MFPAFLKTRLAKALRQPEPIFNVTALNVTWKALVRFFWGWQNRILQIVIGAKGSEGRGLGKVPTEANNNKNTRDYNVSVRRNRAAPLMNK